jgi:type III secretion system-like peptide-binding chaperone
MRRFCVLVLLAALLTPLPRAVAADRTDPALEALRQQHFCEILGYLTAIRSQPMTPRNRYLIVEVAERSGYVQCLFLNNDRKILCEAANGAYDKSGANYVAADRLVTLARLGFSLDGAKSNYQQRRAVRGDASLAKIADLLIRTLHDVYDVAPDHHFRYQAPLVKETPAAQTYVGRRCVAPVS